MTEGGNEMQEERSTLIGYARKSNGRGVIKLSINVDALNGCEVYQTSDGQIYVPLDINIDAMRSILDGHRVVTTISQVVES